jgi:hypothetical protein
VHHGIESTEHFVAMQIPQNISPTLVITVYGLTEHNIHQNAPNISQEVVL